MIAGTREEVIAECRTWIDTKFVHQAGMKGAGVDCAHLMSEVYFATGHMPKVFYPVYGQDWFKHAEYEEKYVIENSKMYFQEVTEAECLPGDWVAIKISKAYAHCALVTQVKDGHPSKGLNAWPTKEKVWEVDLIQDPIFAGRLKRYFSPLLWHQEEK